MPYIDIEAKRENARERARGYYIYPERLFGNLADRASKKWYERYVRTFNKEQFIEWVLSNPVYPELYSNWQASGFEQRLSPSITRIDQDKDFTLDNLVILTFSEASQIGANSAASQYALEQARAKASKKVKCIETGVVYNSQSEAGRALGVNGDNIRKFFKGEVKTVAGFTFERV